MGFPARVLGVTLAAAAGCATCPAKIQTALARPTGHGAEIAARYTLACPDRLGVTVEGRPELSRAYAVEADGCVAAAEFGRVRVEGATTAEASHALARMWGLDTQRVHVAVAEHASRHVLLFGPGEGVQRVVAYVGPETVTDLLRRTGGLAPGAAFRAVHVVRPHVAAGHRPEVFNVDLKAVAVKGDASSDVRLEPYDQVYLGETRGASVAKCLPPWLRAVCPGMKAIDLQDPPAPE